MSRYVSIVRSTVKLVLFLASSVLTAAAIAACVGDDSPATAVGPGAADGSPDPQGEGGKVDTDGSVPASDSAVGDSSPGVDAAVPPLDVKTLPGLRLWLESSQGLTKASTGADIVSWSDSSGNWAAGTWAP